MKEIRVVQIFILIKLASGKVFIIIFAPHPRNIQYFNNYLFMEEIIKIAIVEDKHMMIEGYESKFREYPGFEIVLKAHHGRELFEQIDACRPHFVLTDLNMPVVGGETVIRVLKEFYPHIKIIVISGILTSELITELIDTGAHGFVGKNGEHKDVVNAIYKVIKGYISIENDDKDGVINELRNKNQHNSSSNPEAAVKLDDINLEIIKYKLKGWKFDAIGNKVCRAESTVKTRLSKIYELLELSTIDELRRYVKTHNLFDLDE